MAIFRAPLKVKTPVERAKQQKIQEESNAKTLIFRKTLNGGGAKK